MGDAASPEAVEVAFQRCRAGQTDGFTEIYRLFGRSLYGTALRMLGRPEEAEDAMQDAFISFFRKVPDLPAQQVGAWLHRVLANECIDRLRRGRRWRESELDERSAAENPQQLVSRLDLQAAVAGLPERARLVLLLHDVEGFKHREIGHMLGLSNGTSKSQLFRARAMLREALGRRADGLPRGER